MMKTFKNEYTLTSYAKVQRLYQQTLRQSHYTNLAYTVLSVYKFALHSFNSVPKLKNMTLLSFSLNKKPSTRYLLFTHFLFNWFHKQQAIVNWGANSNFWSANVYNSELWFYLLRYNFLANLKVFPFVPTVQWRQFYPRRTFLLPWTRLLVKEDLPLPFEDYLTLEFSDYYRLGVQLNCQLPTNLPAWYSKVFTLRSHHFPVVYEKKILPLLYAFSLVPFKVPYLFDELRTARFSMDTRKKRLLHVFKTLLKMGRQRQLLTEYVVIYRLQEQLEMLPKVSPAADFVKEKWSKYFKLF